MSLFDGVRTFDYPKSPALIRKFMKMGNAGSDALILDFFAGSATTAHAVMELNAEDGGRRKFIMVQLHEKCKPKSRAYNAGFSNICELSEKRIHLAGRKIIEKHPDAAGKLDIGFRLFKIPSPKVKETSSCPDDPAQQMLPDFEESIKEDRTPEDLLIQAMLALGLPLDAEISRECSDATGNKTVFSVRRSPSGNSIPDLIACFDSEVSKTTAAYIARKQPAYAVFRDYCFKDNSMRVNVECIFTDNAPHTRLAVI